jgi:hypothetical protein
MNVQAALKNQYHAALSMLKQAIDECPDDLWTSQGQSPAFWRVAYHTLFFTHLYLQPKRSAFRPWKYARDGYQDLGPAAPSMAGESYTKSQILEYWQLCDAMVDAGIDGADLDAQECGFSWYKLPKLDHQINNIRHIQHHTALLSGRLRAAVGVDVHWACFK